MRWANLPGPQCCICFGRHRAYVEVGEVDQLHAFTPGSDEVMQYCRERNISAVCPFARVGPDHLAIRVFTTSLSGREDAATCGAVAGLPAYLASLEAAAGAGAWRVDQGTRGPTARGRLYVRCAETAHHIAVGGHTKLLTVGILQESVWT